MATLVSVTVFAKDSTQLSPSVIYALPTDQINFVTAATTRQKQANPSASQGINTAIFITDQIDNEGTSHIYLVNETVATIVSGS